MRPVDLDELLPSFDPPSRIALRQPTAMRPQVDELEAVLVVRARLDRASWRELGGDLGITAQVRFGGTACETRTDRGSQRGRRS